MNHIIYSVYGSVNYGNEALYSMLSYYSFHTSDENRLVLYSDRTEFFRLHLPESVIYRHVDAAELEDWTGTDNYTHRIKIKVLQDACSKFDGNFLYFDTDTVYRKNVSELFKMIEGGCVIFHKDEGPLSENQGGIARKMKKFLKKNSAIEIEGSDPVEIDEHLIVRNSGVIGFNNNYCERLRIVEKLCDALYSRQRIFYMEQIAFSYAFQNEARLAEAEDFVYHYWHFKEFRPVLRAFFDHHNGLPFTAIQKEISNIDPERLSEGKVAYKAMGFWEKQWWKVWKGYKWKIADYKFSESLHKL